MQQGLVSRAYFLREGQGAQGLLRVRLATDSAQSAHLQAQLTQLLSQKNLLDKVTRIEVASDAAFDYHEVLFEGVSAQTMLEDFFSDTNAFLLEAISELQGDETTRLRVAFDLMVASSVAISKHIIGDPRVTLKSAFFVYSIHSEGFLMASKNPHTTRQAFEQRYERVSEPMQQRFQALMHQFESGADVVSPFAQRWSSYIDSYVEQVSEALSSGSLQIKPDFGEQAGISVSPFYQAMKGNRAFRAYTPEGGQFPVMRATFSYLFWTLARLGVNLLSRYFLCYVISRIFEQVSEASDTVAHLAPDPASIQKTWAELRVRVDEASQDRVLIEGIAPFLDTTIKQGLITRGYFLRRGKSEQASLNLYLDITSADTGQLRDILCDICQQKELSNVVEQVEEGVSAGFVEIQESFQGPAAQPLLEGFFCDTTDFLLKLITEINDGESARFQSVFDLMVAQVVAVNRNVSLGAHAFSFPTSFLTYRSHSDGFFIMSKDPEAAKKKFEARYTAVSPVLQKRLQQLLQQFDDAGPVVSQSAQSWFSYIDTYIRRVIAEMSAGRLEVIQDQTGYLGDQNDISISPLHQVIQHNAHYQEFMKADIEFLAMRAMYSYLYSTLYRLGLRLIERYFLCYSVCRAFEEMFNVDAADVLTVIARKVFSAPRSGVSAKASPEAV
jgi:hypothetical protein